VQESYIPGCLTTSSLVQGEEIPLTPEQLYELDRLGFSGAAKLILIGYYTDGDKPDFDPLDFLQSGLDTKRVFGLDTPELQQDYIDRLKANQEEEAYCRQYLNNGGDIRQNPLCKSRLMIEASDPG
jgi:hypothetical protein